MDFELQALISTEDGSSSAKPTSTGTQQGQLSHTTLESKHKIFEAELAEATSNTITNTAPKTHLGMDVLANRPNVWWLRCAWPHEQFPIVVVKH